MTNIDILYVLVTIGIFLFLMGILWLISNNNPKNGFDFQKDLKNITIKRTVIKNNKQDRTLLGISPNKRQIYMPNDARHIFVCGTTGSGKTIALSNFIKSAVDFNYPALIIDGKGDISDDSLLDITQKIAKDRKLYVINFNSPQTSDRYNPFKATSPTIIKDMLINLTNWSEEHYKLNTERYLQRLIDLLFKSEAPLSFKNIVENMKIDNFLVLSKNLLNKKIITKEEHLLNIEITQNSGKIAETASARFAGIIESELGSIFDVNGIDIYSALQENAIILFVLNPLLYPELSPLIGNLLIIDAKKAISNLFNGQHKRIFFIMDEINVYITPSMLDLVNKSRSANVTCILATQSLSDLSAKTNNNFEEQIIENCNNYIILRQNSGVNAEKLANVIGTHETFDYTYQMKKENSVTTDTGLGSAKKVRVYNYHPDVIKSLPCGKAILVNKDDNFSSFVFINKPF